MACSAMVSVMIESRKVTFFVKSVAFAMMAKVRSSVQAKKLAHLSHVSHWGSN